MVDVCGKCIGKYTVDGWYGICLLIQGTFIFHLACHLTQKTTSFLRTEAQGHLKEVDGEKDQLQMGYSILVVYVYKYIYIYVSCCTSFHKYIYICIFKNIDIYI